MLASEFSQQQAELSSLQGTISMLQVRDPKSDSARLLPLLLGCSAARQPASLLNVGSCWLVPRVTAFARRHYIPGAACYLPDRREVGSFNCSRLSTPNFFFPSGMCIRFPTVRWDRTTVASFHRRSYNVLIFHRPWLPQEAEANRSS